MVDAAQIVATETRVALPVLNIAGASLRIFLRGFPLFFALGVLSAIPSAIHLVVFHPVPGRLFDPPSLAVSGVRSIVQCFLQIPLVFVAVRMFERRDYALADAFALGLQRYLPVLGAVILYLLAFYGGLILLIVPGVIVLCTFAVVVPVAALESLGPIAALRRAAALTRFNRWRVLAIYLLYFVPLMIVGFILGLVTTLRGHALLGQWFGIFVQAAWGPLAGVLSAAVYTALRRLKDGVGSQVISVFD